MTYDFPSTINTPSIFLVAWRATMMSGRLTPWAMLVFPHRFSTLDNNTSLFSRWENQFFSLTRLKSAHNVSKLLVVFGAKLERLRNVDLFCLEA